LLYKRELTLEECKYVFEKIWKNSIDHAFEGKNDIDSEDIIKYNKVKYDKKYIRVPPSSKLKYKDSKHACLVELLKLLETYINKISFEEDENGIEFV
jgi:hypothetical protein